MDRRRFLRGAGMLGAGAVLGAAGSEVVRRPKAPDWLPGDHVAARAFAGEPWGDERLVATRVVWKVDTPEKLLALTFDDGPKPDYTAAVLDVLADRRVRATFNLVGSRALAYPELVRREIADRHEIGNHTWSHGNLAFLDEGRTATEIRRADEAIERVTGRRTTIFRPPRGNITGAALEAAARHEYDVVLWSMQLHETTFDAEGNAQYVAQNVTPGTILLAHDAGKPLRRVGLAALPLLIDRLRDRGYRFVTTSELLEAGQPVGPPADH